MTFSEYISHPATTEDDEDTLLIGEGGKFDDSGHLRTVADRMVDACRGQTLSDGTRSESVTEVIGLTHDFAKLTRWAQKHLRDQPFQRQKEYRYHAFPSALVTLYCLRECNDDFSEHATEIATLVVAGHHDVRSPPEPSTLTEQYGRTTDGVRETYDRVCDQFDDIDEEVPQRADRIISAATGGDGSWADFQQWHDDRMESDDETHEHLLYFARMGHGEPGVDYYADVIQLWTALKFADQTAASGLTYDDIGGTLPDRSALDRHIEALDEGEGTLAELNDLRDRARREATDNVDDLMTSDDVGLLTLPTGFGKTYAGLAAGLRATDISDSRLVYVLPYTSILDQTANEIQRVFEVNPYSRSFTLHHHLSDTYTGLGDHYTDADIGRSPGALHAESWLSGLTLTTTVQLFESLTAPTARQATRIPSLRDAVIVIDEPQAIPEDWWKIVPILVEILVDRYDATVILMTATQPGIVKYGSETLDTRELTDDPARYTDFLAENPRVTYQLHDTVETNLRQEVATLDYATAGRRVSAAADGKRDALAVCNTRSSARELYRNVRSTAGEENAPVELGRLLYEYVVAAGELPSSVHFRRLAIEAVAENDAETIYAYLSGDVRPDDRALILDALYDDEVGDGDDPSPLLDRATSVVLVSTSVVEAGVDVSFDTVFRDFAPIPNIVQSGGRCNRSFDGDGGEVVVWRLAEPTDGYGIPSLSIHGGDAGDALPLLRETGRVLRRHATEDGRIDESTMVSDTVTDFYGSLFEGVLDPGDERLARAIESASTSQLEGTHMIEEIDGYEDVIVCLTDEERSDLLHGTLDPSDVWTYPGAQVNTDLEGNVTELTTGNSTYYLLDARDDSYHPVFGVR